MRIDGAVERLVASPDAEYLFFRVSAGLPWDQLFEAVQEAVERFEAEWSRDQPAKTNWGEDAPPPEVVLSSTPPDVVVTFLKITDLTVSFRRFMVALESTLPADARIRKLDTSRLPWHGRGPKPYLELRVALIGETGDFPHWAIDPAAVTRVDLVAVDWLRAAASDPVLYLSPAAAPEVPVAPGSELLSLNAQRDRAFSAHLSVAAGQAFRAASFWFPTGHLSLVVGSGNPVEFDWLQARNALLDVFTELEPFTQSAFLRRDEDLGLTCVGAHASRKLHLVPNRASLNDGRERRLEERGLVDAQGEFFLSSMPSSPPPGWSQAPFGHLAHVSASNLDAWLGQTPTEQTIAEGRAALSPLLSEWVGPDELNEDISTLMVTIADAARPVLVDEAIRQAVDQLVTLRLVQLTSEGDGTLAVATDRGRGVAESTKYFRKQHGYPG